MLIANLRWRVLAGIIVLGVASAVWANDPKKSAAPTLVEASKLPFKQQTDAEANMAVRVIGGLLVVVLLGYGAVYTMKRYFPSLYGHSTTMQRSINVVEVRRLTPKATLFLVDVDGVRLLLAQSGDRITTLHQKESHRVKGHGKVENADD